MPSRPNVTTPGGFFVGLGGIVCFSLVAAVVYYWVRTPAPTAELKPQQIALGLRAADDAKGDDLKKKEAESAALLQAAAQRYNGGVTPDLDKLDDLRGVVRYREAQKTIAEAEKALTGAAAWKDKAKGEVTMPIALAMNVVANGLKDRKPKASAVKVDISPALDPNAPPVMPNAMGGGAKTVFFADPNAVAAPSPAAATAPTTPPAAAPTQPAPAPVTPPATAPAPSATPATPPAAPAPTALPAPTPATPPAAPPVPAPTPATPPAAPAPPAPVPATPPASPAPVPTSGASVTTPPVSVAANVPAPARPTLLNWPESKK